jgi:hypothetical protein
MDFQKSGIPKGEGPGAIPGLFAFGQRGARSLRIMYDIRHTGRFAATKMPRKKSKDEARA